MCINCCFDLGRIETKNSFFSTIELQNVLSYLVSDGFILFR